MGLHRRQLPILSPCEDFAPAPGSVDEGGFCERCRKQVHDASAMSEAELRRFLAARVGTEVCLSYRTDARGRLRLRPEPASAQWQPLALGALASLLAACSWLADETVIPGGYCLDPNGEEVPCVESFEHDAWSMPAAEGCPVRPTAPVPAPVLAPAPAPTPLTGPAPAVGDAAPGARPTAAKFRANFKIDPDEQVLRGAVVVTGVTTARDFVPTATLWREWRERRAERKRARAR